MRFSCDLSAGALWNEGYGIMSPTEGPQQSAASASEASREPREAPRKPYRPPCLIVPQLQETELGGEGAIDGPITLS